MSKSTTYYINANQASMECGMKDMRRMLHRRSGETFTRSDDGSSELKSRKKNTLNLTNCGKYLTATFKNYIRSIRRIWYDETRDKQSSK